MTSSVSYTSRLLNHVEPYYVDGVAKSAFYTEVNSNVRRNDKVFILNGYHDSEIFISKGKYAKNADGYKVLYVDRCKIVLDIDYKGVTQSYKEDEFDSYIKIHHVTSKRQFDYINTIYIDSYSQSRFSKFEKGYTNNIIFSDSIYFGVGSGLGENSGVTSTKGFWARNGNIWINVTNQFNYNTFTFSSDYYAYGLTNNGKIYIVGEDMEYAGKVYKQRNIYKYGTASINDWRIDIEYKQPIVTKLNFRQGVFRGIHNDGIFGSYLKEENWYGTQSKWNSGFLVNSNWNTGVMYSKSTNELPSYYATIENGQPIQSTDFSNNKGFGYNYILDSNIYKGQIINGNFINCNVGVISNGLTAVDSYFGVTNSYNVSTIGGLYNYCDISNSEITESTTLDSIINNSYLLNTRTLNSQLFDSYSNGGEFSIDSGMSIISADITSYIPNNSTLSLSNIRGVLKLYISDKDYSRLDVFDNFYITKINKGYILSSINDDQKILLPYETRYVLDNFFDFKVSGITQLCIASIKSRAENKYKTTVLFPSLTHIKEVNGNSYASIDIDLGSYLAFYVNSSNTYTYLNQNIIKKDNVQNLFSNTYITNSDFRNGVIKNIRWTSGSSVNPPSNIIKIENNKLKIAKVSTDEIEIYLSEPKPTINDEKIKVGNKIWIDSIQHADNNGFVNNISGVYKITKIEYPPSSGLLPNESRITITNPSIISPISSSGTYSVHGYTPTYVSINELLIDSSEVNSGLFIRNTFKNTTFVNESFVNDDRSISLSNVEKLRIINQVFKDNNNTIKSGIVHKSHVVNVDWQSGILNNSIWNGATFGNGIFNSGYWQSGTFNNGYFQNSKDVLPTIIDYDNDTHYKNWLSGTFNNGIFNKSTWLSGIFNNGRLYNSDWYGGVWNNGILGDKNIPTSNTNLSRFLPIGIGATQTFWYDGIVENAQVGGDGIVYWYGGKFNNGVFTSNGTSDLNESIWYGGEFNGGDFTRLSIWRDGTFNKGKFTSYYGWTMSSSTYSTDYGWQDGIFNGGQFGVADYGTNSVWYDGEFNGGIFQGRVWNNGIFMNGNFNGGSSTYSVINDELQFTESFTNSYYGLWKNGWVTNIKHKAITDELISDNNLRNNQVDIQKIASLKNILWVNGNFDHPSGKIENSAWLGGRFKSGIFKDSVFNSYSRRDWWDDSFGTYSSFNLNLFDCVWENGTFDNGTFYISDWYNGKFINGTMSGALWINGVWNYGYAKNIYWSNGIWKNGMWNGSPFDYNNINDSQMIYNKDRDILLRVSNIMGNSNIHLINAFTGSYTGEILVNTNPTSFLGWTFSDLNSATNWSAGSGLRLVSGSLSSPDITIGGITYLMSNTLKRYTIDVSSTVSIGDTYRIIIYFNNTYGTITITAVSGDTSSSIATKLYNKISQGVTSNVVEQPGGGALVRWRNLNGNITTHPLVSNLSGSSFYVTVRAPWSVSKSTTGVQINSYTASEVLYAMTTDTIGLTTSIFTDSTRHSVSLTVISLNGRTDFSVFVGSEIHNETINNTTTTFNYTYRPTGSPTYLGIKRIMYNNPSNSTFVLLSASVKKIEANYANIYNNKLYQFSTQSSFNYGITGSTISIPNELIPTIVSDGEVVSLNFGNGVFKSGIWEGGYWNNGWRGSWDNTDDIIMFTNVVTGGVLEVSPNTWIIKLQAFGQTTGLSVGDNVSIGNIVCIDINENRRLITGYYRITSLDISTITVQVSLNMPVRRIIKDSESHMIYVTKNIWLSGVFHNGYFRGIWNYGLFRGYPYITVMENSHWIDGVFDGGRFIATQSNYVSVGVTYSYNTGLIQNFTFRDNNIATANNYLYNSWIDVNYITYSMSNIYRDNIRYDSTYNLNISDGNLRGYPTNDILSSDSILRNSYDTNTKSYKLGSKFKIYTDFIGDGSFFNYPLSTSGDPGVGEFVSNGWTYSNLSSQYSSNTSVSDENILLLGYSASVSKNTLDNTYSRQIEKFRYSVIDFDILYSTSSVITTSTTTTTTTILPSYYIVVNPNPVTPGSSYFGGGFIGVSSATASVTLVAFGGLSIGGSTTGLITITGIGSFSTPVASQGQSTSVTIVFPSPGTYNVTSFSGIFVGSSGNSVRIL